MAYKNGSSHTVSIVSCVVTVIMIPVDNSGQKPKKYKRTFITTRNIDKVIRMFIVCDFLFHLYDHKFLFKFLECVFCYTE